MTHPAEQQSIQPGQVIAGKYRVDRILGSGGMGTVVAAIHLDLDELRAVKLMHPSQLENAQAVERFLREARATRRLKSEHVPMVYDVGRLESGAPYLVMEVLEGTDLRGLLKGRGQMPIEESVLFILQACEAIAEAHAIGIIHRDLKPANLFLTRRDDGSPCIKVLDFGVSKLLFDPNSAAGVDMTKTLDVLGSIHYMAPEQLRSSRSVDARADVFSLGVILYRLLTGRLPFQGDTPVAYIMALRDPLHPPSAFRSDLPPELDAVIMHSLEKDPERRTGSVAELMIGLIPFGPGGNGPRLAPMAEGSDSGEQVRAARAAQAALPPPPVPESYDDVDSLDLSGAETQPIEADSFDQAMAAELVESDLVASGPYVPPTSHLYADDADSQAGGLFDVGAEAVLDGEAEADAEAVTDASDLLEEIAPPSEPDEDVSTLSAVETPLPAAQPVAKKEARRPAPKPLSLSLFILLGCLLGALAGIIIAVVIVVFRTEPGPEIAAPGPALATAPPAAPEIVPPPVKTAELAPPTAPASTEMATAPSATATAAASAVVAVGSAPPVAPSISAPVTNPLPPAVQTGRAPTARKGTVKATETAKTPPPEPPRSGPIFE